MTDHKISVIIPFCGELSFLDEAIESVLEQSYKNVEIIIINDGSKHKMDQFLSKYGPRIKYIEQENKGAAAARNVGIELAQGEYIAFLDADDLWERNKLQSQLNHMLKNGAVWSHTSYRRFQDGKILKEVNLKGFQGRVFPKCLATNPIATPCIMIRRDVLKENKDLRFPEDMIYGEDLFLWLLLARLYDLYLVPDYLTRVRIRGSNAALQSYAQLKSRTEIWKKFNSDKLNFPDTKIGFQIKLPYYFCCMTYKILQNITDLKLRELLSKLLYIIPWGLFKLAGKYGDLSKPELKN